MKDKTLKEKKDVPERSKLDRARYKGWLQRLKKGALTSLHNELNNAAVVNESLELGEINPSFLSTVIN